MLNQSLACGSDEDRVPDPPSFGLRGLPLFSNAPSQRELCASDTPQPQQRNNMTDQQSDGRKSRKRRSRSKTGRKNPAASAALRKKWAEDPEYRAKQSKYNKEVLPFGRPTREGVPDGMTREEAEPLWEQARRDADFILATLEKQRQIDFDPSISEEEMAKICLREALAIALSPMGDNQVKTRAARIVLKYTKPLPASSSELTLRDLEIASWLRNVFADHLATSQSTKADTAY
jgi:hypothetical protein